VVPSFSTPGPISEFAKRRRPISKNRPFVRPFVRRLSAVVARSAVAVVEIRVESARGPLQRRAHISLPRRRQMAFVTTRVRAMFSRRSGGAANETKAEATPRKSGADAAVSLTDLFPGDARSSVNNRSSTEAAPVRKPRPEAQSEPNQRRSSKQQSKAPAEGRPVTETNSTATAQQAQQRARQPCPPPTRPRTESAAKQNQRTCRAARPKATPAKTHARRCAARAKGKARTDCRRPRKPPRANGNMDFCEDFYAGFIMPPPRPEFLAKQHQLEREGLDETSNVSDYRPKGLRSTCDCWRCQRCVSVFVPDYLGRQRLTQVYRAEGVDSVSMAATAFGAVATRKQKNA